MASQIHAHMKDIMPFDEYLKGGNLTPIREYLRDSIQNMALQKLQSNPERCHRRRI